MGSACRCVSRGYVCMGSVGRDLLAWELSMGLKDVVFLLSRSSFHITFHINSGRGESLRTTRCRKTVLGISHGMLPVNYFWPNKAFFVSVEVHGDHKTVTKMK